MRADICMVCCRGLFGEQCSFDQVRKELVDYSDFALHSFAAAHGKAFVKFLMPAERVEDAAKCCFLKQLLPKLQARLVDCMGYDCSLRWHKHVCESCRRACKCHL